jgi:hypothetical protein
MLCPAMLYPDTFVLINPVSALYTVLGKPTKVMCTSTLGGPYTLYIFLISLCTGWMYTDYKEVTFHKKSIRVGNKYTTNKNRNTEFMMYRLVTCTFSSKVH